MKINRKFLSPYDSVATESRIYELWEKSGFFNPDICVSEGITGPDAPTFSMVLPPPNVTGRLHLGHALEHAIQDTVVRFERMRGKRTLWIPGSDHAAIATQAKYEKELTKKEGKSRHDFSRDEFFERVHSFGLENQKSIREQLRLLGASLDWTREAFTLDREREQAVRTAFKRMYDEGLIYRKDRVVNWDPKGQTTVSDDEVVHEEEMGKLYTFKYSKDFPIPIATTRPETKVGDTAVAVHPEDARYSEYVGQTYSLVFAGTELVITIVGDHEVDPEYGTGAIGVTPAHSMVDYEIAERHGLPLKQVINEYAKMTEAAGTLVAGLKTREAREKIVEWLKEQDLLINEEDQKQNISKAERTGGVIEPLPKLQWFIDVNKEFRVHQSMITGIENRTPTTLKEMMRAAVAGGQVTILPERFEKVYFHWIDNLRDWCISRQILYGHRIPVWYREEEIYVGIEPPEGEGWEQDQDTLDTWFSSSLWTFTTLGWPEHTTDLEVYHPTTLVNMGYEILFMWAARMIMMTTFHTGEIPFETLYIHGMVRDKQGRKFSKSLNNGIEPEEIIEKYGTDALRMSMLVGIGPGSDVSFDESKVKAYKHFANKIWNASRFVLERLPDDYVHGEHSSLLSEHQKRIEELRDLITEVTEDIENYRLYLASEKLYHYFWHTFADIIIEETKSILEEGNEEERASAEWMLLEILQTSLRLLHPFMPFVTEEVWTELPLTLTHKRLLLVEKWPEVQ